jgi:pimeloyl-ACP methyl ester carboxylesterase
MGGRGGGRGLSARRDGTVTAGGIASRLIEAGPENATEAVVFVHGNPGSASDWSGLVASVGDFARAIAFDMPGFGKTGVPSGFDYSVDSYGAFLGEALDALGVERAHLVLHDFGGPFGFSWGLAHPDAWRSVVLLNIGMLPSYRWHSMARRWRTPVLGEIAQAWIPRFAWRRAMAAASPRGMPLEFVDKMYDEYDRETRRTVLALYRATPDPGTAAEVLGPQIAALHKPALVVWGTGDPYASGDYAERQREYFDVRRIVTLPDSGHWPFQDDPSATAEAVLPFLREQLGA